MSIETLAIEISNLSHEILRKEDEILKLKRGIAESEKNLELSKIPIEKEVLNNPSFKNDSQRKTAIKEMLEKSELINNIEKEIMSQTWNIEDLEYRIKVFKIEKNYKETLLKLEFIKLEKGL